MKIENIDFNGLYLYLSKSSELRRELVKSLDDQLDQLSGSLREQIREGAELPNQLKDYQRQANYIIVDYFLVREIDNLEGAVPILLDYFDSYYVIHERRTEFC